MGAAAVRDPGYTEHLLWPEEWLGKLKKFGSSGSRLLPAAQPFPSFSHKPRAQGSLAAASEVVGPCVTATDRHRLRHTIELQKADAHTTPWELQP